MSTEKEQIDWSGLFISSLKAIGILVLIIAMSRNEWYGVIISLVFYIMLDVVQHRGVY